MKASPVGDSLGDQSAGEEGQRASGGEPVAEKIPRRKFCQAAAVGLGSFALGGYLAERRAFAEQAGPMLPPIVTGHSAEICMNSRVSKHSGLTGTPTDQQLANVLWAAGRAPVTGSYRTIYLKTKNRTYIYHPETHSLANYSSETVTNAFRLDYDRERDFDMGVSYVLGLWEAVSLWSGTSSQVISCPQQSDVNFGIGSVSGLTTQLVALSSNGTLPNPQTDGPDGLENVIAGLRLHDAFALRADLTPAQISQVLWAGYGCTPHMTANGYGGLTVPSWMADYYLTGKIYVVADKVSRYCNRVGTNKATRDHRLELVKNADVRTQVRGALAGMPAAPCYILLCLTQAGLGVWSQRLETGMAAGGMLVQAGALGLGCAFKAALSAQEQAALQQITQIPATDFPHAVVAVGRPLAAIGAGEEVELIGAEPINP
jgi:hypothetical protein